MSDLILSERRGAAAIITLNRPEALNAFPHAMIRQFEREVRAAVADPDVVGIVVTGAGRGFSAGLDMSALTDSAASGSSSRELPPEDVLHGLFSFMVQQPKPIIGAINGVAAGGGFVLAMKCDIRFASPNASFITIFSKRGLIAEHGMTWLLPKAIGTASALDLLWSSRKVEADEALRLGLVQRVVAADRLVDEAVEYIEMLAANVSPASMADTKRLVYEGAGQEIAEAFREADEATFAGLDRPDAAEGAASFIEKRPPRFPRIGS